MTTSIFDVRAAMSKAIATINGLSAQPYELDTINAPIAYVVSLEFDPRFVLTEAKSERPFQIRVYAPRAANVQNQKLLDGYRETHGDTSIMVAIQESDNYPPDLVDYVMVTRIGAIGVVEVAGIPYLYLEIDAEVCW